jgi:hypothetical protein
MCVTFSTKCRLFRKFMSLGSRNIYVFRKSCKKFKCPLRKIRRAGTYSLDLTWHLNYGEQYLSQVISDRCKTGVPNSCTTPTQTHAVTLKLPQLHFRLLKQCPSNSTNLPRPLPTPTTTGKAVKNSKWSLTLPCGKTVTSQHSLVYNRVLHKTAG